MLGITQAKSIASSRTSRLRFTASDLVGGGFVVCNVHI